MSHPIPPRDTIELLQKNSLFHQGDISSAAYQLPVNITFVLAHPRSGSTLLMRLMNMACLSPMTGDRPINFYKGAVMMHRALADPNHGQFGHLFIAEEKGQFWDEYRGESKSREQYLFKFVTGMILGSCNHKSAYAKSTMLGFGNNLAVPFVQMLRDNYDGDHGFNDNFNLRIVFLRRDHDEIIRSFRTREGPGQETAIKSPATLKLFLEEQDRQFKQAYELGDAKITYDQLIADPAACLKKLNPLYSPNLKAMESIMAKKIR